MKINSILHKSVGKKGRAEKLIKVEVGMSVYCDSVVNMLYSLKRVTFIFMQQSMGEM